MIHTAAKDLVMPTTHEIQLISAGDGSGVLVSTTSDQIAKATIVVPVGCEAVPTESDLIHLHFLARMFNSAVN